MFTRSLLALSFALFTTYAFALPEDREQPIEITGDNSEFQEQQGYSIYTGNVHYRQGSMNIQSDWMRAEHPNQDIRYAEAESRSDTPVRFQQLTDANKPPLYATGKRMEYFVKDEKVVLHGNAHAWQDGHELFGERIDYNLKTGELRATRLQSTGQVRTILPPKKKTP
ncbi:MAG: lipopolysaccharide transport periplasmic protein LptA [Gammaproteobacteria bacterium]